MTILVIANKGSFFLDIQEKLGGEGFTYHEITPSSSRCLPALIMPRYSKVVYLGGETRFEGKMYEANYQLPKIIYDKCREYNTNFLYLSSLSVFGWVNTDSVHVDSVRDPLDLYGETKNMFDAYVNEFSLDNVSVLYPASIHAGRGRSSVEKISKLYTKLSILKCIKLPGVLSFVYRDQLIDDIASVVNSDKAIKKISSQDFVVASLAFRFSIALPKLPHRVFLFAGSLIGKRKALVLKMLLRGIYYK
jgi:hypothetical protein